ncbi:MAG: carbon-nitrogen hydrolase [Patescibacteria group bacterium]
MTNGMKNKFVTVAAVQSAVSADLEANLLKTVKTVEQAARKGAQIICLQELFRTPYFPVVPKVPKEKYAETIPGKTTNTMSKLAKKLGVVIIAPIFEKDKNGKYYNTAAVFDEKGKLLEKYHKIHIPHDPGFYEKDYFEKGESGYKIFKTKFGNFAVLICFDQWFPEAARAVKLSGAEIIFYPTAIANVMGYMPPEGNWHNAWETVMRGHAIANGIPVVAANRTGVEGKSRFWGQSFICDAFGKILKRASATKEQIIIAKIDLSMNDFVSNSWGFLHDRRPDTYKILTDKKFVKNLVRSKKVEEEEKKLKKILEK